MFTLDDSPDYICADTVIETNRLLMRLEDFMSFLNFRSADHLNDLGPAYKQCIPRRSAFDFSTLPEVATFNHVECSLMDLYQLIEDTRKIIMFVESAVKSTGRLSLGNFKIDVRVIANDSPFVEKELSASQFLYDNVYEKQPDCFCRINGKKKNDFNSVVKFFPSMENDMYMAFNKIEKFDDLHHNFTIKNPQETQCKSAIIMELEYKMLKKSKLEEKEKVTELEWQCNQAKLKKSYFFNKSKRISAKEDELRKLSKAISEETVKNAKERQNLELKTEELLSLHNQYQVLFNQKVDYITKILQEIEDTMIELPEQVPKELNSNASKFYEVHSVTEEVPLEVQIKELEKELLNLEIEYRSSKVAESLETISTNITRVKSRLLNLQSLNAMKKTERTSSAVRSTIKSIEKHWENVLEQNTANTVSSNNADSNHSRPFKAPLIPTGKTFKLSPLRKLEATTSRLDFSTLDTPSRRSSTFVKTNLLHSDIDMKKFLRKKEELLKDREEEVIIEEKKLQDLWMNAPEGREMIPLIQHEIFEYRKLRQEFYRKNEVLEREKNECRERFKTLEQKEKELKNNEFKIKALFAELEQNKIKIAEKLEWLKRKLMQNDVFYN